MTSALTDEATGVVVLGPKRPDESDRDYFARLAESNPKPTRELCALLARLLPPSGAATPVKARAAVLLSVKQ